MKNRIVRISVYVLVLVAMFSCKKVIFVEDELTGDNIGSATHSNGLPANYDVVFNNETVNRIEIVFTAQEWADMQTNLTEVTRNSGPGSFSDVNPTYFAADIYYNDLVWKDVGVRYKGNSSLTARSGKLPLRLDFDKFEEENPGIADQRFYGFKELSLSSNYNDAAVMREKSASDLFRDFGVPAVHTAFYEVYINKGNGPEYYGVYTMTEVVFDTFLKDYFGSKSGNCYKPEEDGANFAQTGFTLDGFELKTNEEVNDKSDIQAMYNALHSANRTSNPVQWKTDLEAVFDVDGFLKYLAVNNTIQNWDTYGKMPHNYYLYHDPADDILKWIVWDNNEAFSDGKQGGAVSFGMSEVGTSWPLINYLIADEDYLATYKSYVKSFVETSFAETRMSGIYSSQQTLLNTSVSNERTGYSYVNGQFNSAVSTLKTHNKTRIAAANAYVQ
jgi:spore coat protein H